MIAEVSEDVASLQLILGLVFGNALMLSALWCWNTGWGNGGERLMRRNPRSWALFVVSIGFTILPFTISSCFATAFAIALYLYERTDSAVFAWIGLVLVVPFFATGGWGFKEYFRPSPWRKAPAWVRRFNLR